MLIILTVRSARLGKSPKSDILFHLSTSGGLSGVRKESEVLLLQLQTINRLITFKTLLRHYSKRTLTPW